MKKYKLILAIMCTGVLVLTGCSGTSSSTTDVTGQEEQAVQEESISFLREVGIDYISVSAYRVLEARLSTARVEILNKKSR